jgi:hypothetical protein
MRNKEFQETIKLLADKAKLAEYNDLAIVLYTYLGAEKMGVSSDFARHSQKFAKEMSSEIKLFNNRRNN